MHVKARTNAIAVMIKRALCQRRRHPNARTAPQVRSAALDPDNASILVCGGGGVALEVTRKLKDLGAWVWMLQRSDSRRYVQLLLPYHQALSEAAVIQSIAKLVSCSSTIRKGKVNFRFDSAHWKVNKAVAGLRLRA